MPILAAFQQRAVREWSRDPREGKEKLTGGVESQNSPQRFRGELSIISPVKAWHTALLHPSLEGGSSQNITMPVGATL